ncbi:hypothetical protein AAFC00_006226 [Neodothiora populina]|uniref:Endoplasmic reticulum lectin n=1 Tax=Neodothiora populina TaxID=2781224 RepID=A0ABR3P4F6_9PEZI
MRSFWALPAVLRVVLASQHVFSVQDDVLAYPQFEIIYSDDYLTEAQAQALRNGDHKEHQESIIQDPTSETDIALNGGNTHDDDDSKHAQKDPLKYEYEEMILGNRRYSCRIPIIDVAAGRPDANQTLTKQEEEKELARANDRGWELLQGMQGSCVYFWSGWWSYQYCYGKGVKQFHQLPPSQGIPAYPPVEDPGVTGFTLGSVEESLPKEMKGVAKSKTGQASKALGTLETRGENRYLVQRLGGGTVCDLTGRERRVEVQFHCDPTSSDKISGIKEIATCAYLMIIKTPRLCNDVAFLPPRKDKPNTISCSPVIAEDQIADYEKELKEAQRHEDHGDHIENPFEEPQSKPPPVIGGIMLGAHKWVSEDAHIQRSAIVGGGKETFVETIADSMGKLMSPEQLKKMGLGDAKSVEELKKELEKIADGQAWKLDVFDTPQGREYRGVLLGDEDKDEEGRGSDEGKGGEDGEDRRSDVEDSEGGGEAGSEETYKDEL